MTHADLKKDLLFLAKQNGMNEDGLDDHVDFAIDRGTNLFWCANGWSWSTREYELDVSSETDEYELPDDFRGIRSVRQQETTYGGSVVYLTPEEFDELFPHPAGYTSGVPLYCTIRYDRDDKVTYIKFARPPESGSTIIIDMYTTKGEVSGVPDGYEGGLIAAIEMFLHKVGSRERLAAKAAFEDEVIRLMPLDSGFQGDISQILQPKPIRVNDWGPRLWFG